VTTSRSLERKAPRVGVRASGDSIRGVNVKSQLVYVAAAITFTLGLLGLVNPLFTARMLGLEVVAMVGLSQVRATFGAMHLALTALIMRGTMQRAGAVYYLRSSALLVGAVLVGRLLSIFIDGAFTLLNLLFVVSEGVALAGILLALLDPERRSQTAEPRAR